MIVEEKRSSLRDKVQAVYIYCARERAEVLTLFWNDVVRQVS